MDESKVVRSSRDVAYLKVILLVWTVFVVFMAANHVPWRDETRALLTTNEGNFSELPERMKYDGHPLLWYLLLRIAYGIYAAPVVLKVLSVAVAFTAVAVFLFRSPFPVWFKALFVFSGLPAYHYSVIARNYGISMLFFFLFTAVYTGDKRRPLLAGLTIFFLANTNVHSAILATLLLGLWALERRVSLFSSSRLWSRDAAGLAIGLVGIVLCLLTVARGSGQNTAANGGRPLSGILTAAVGSIRSPIAGFSKITSAEGLQHFVRAASFGYLDSSRLAGWLAFGLLFVAIAGLLSRPLLAATALTGMYALAFLFRFVYHGEYRHEGLFLIFLVVLYWMKCTERVQAGQYPEWPVPSPALRWQALPLVPLVVVSLSHSLANNSDELFKPYSSARDVSAFLHSKPELANATILAVPEYMLEALPYYSIKDYKYLCPGTSKTYADFSPRPACHLTLTGVIRSASDLRARTGRPVVILLSKPLDKEAGTLESSFSTFSWTPEEYRNARTQITQLASFRRAITDENYDVYILN